MGCHTTPDTKGPAFFSKPLPITNTVRAMRLACALWVGLFAVGCLEGSPGSNDAGATGDAGSVVDSGQVDAGTPNGDAGSPVDSGLPAADAGSGSFALFEAPEPWTKDVSASLKSTRSDDIIGALKSLGGWGAGALRVDFSIPVFYADSTTPRKTITANTASGPYCYGGPDCDPVPLQMPVPANANIEGSNDLTCDTSYATDGQGDCHLLVVERSEKKLYELYNSTANGAGLVALGAFVWNLKTAYPDSLRGDQCTSADAAGFPMAGLLPTADEVAAGEIKHALRFILPNERMKKGVFVHPATHSGSPSATDANAPPYGVRFRLKGSFDETGFNPSQRVVLRALKKYGMLLSDGGNIALTFADDRTSTAKWATLGVASDSFKSISVDAFEVVELGAEIPRNADCVR